MVFFFKIVIIISYKCQFEPYASYLYAPTNYYVAIKLMYVQNWHEDASGRCCHHFVIYDNGVHCSLDRYRPVSFVVCTVENTRCISYFYIASFMVVATVRSSVQLTYGCERKFNTYDLVNTLWIDVCFVSALYKLAGVLLKC